MGVQPALHYNGEVLLRHWIDKRTIPVKPQQHLLYDAWNYTLKNGGGTWNIEKE